jgi:hypothetical protein
MSSSASVVPISAWDRILEHQFRIGESSSQIEMIFHPIRNVEQKSFAIIQNDKLL